VHDGSFFQKATERHKKEKDDGNAANTKCQVRTDGLIDTFDDAGSEDAELINLHKF
jgi:hypothetical protein